jgi:hypothetical protein
LAHRRERVGFTGVEYRKGGDGKPQAWVARTRGREQRKEFAIAVFGAEQAKELAIAGVSGNWNARCARVVICLHAGVRHAPRRRRNSPAM